MSTIGNRFNTLDGLRGVAALAVMLYHYTQFSTFPIFGKAYLAVDLFFCLSGFVIAYSYQQRLSEKMQLGEFFKRRLIRLYPMFFIGIMLGFVAMLLKITNGQTDFTFFDSMKSLLLNSFYIPYFSDKSIQIGEAQTPGVAFPLNDPAWSLFFELVINLAFAFYLTRKWTFTPLGLMLTSFLGLVTWIAYNKMTGTIGAGWGSDNFFGGFPRTTFSFFLGVFIFNFPSLLKKYIPALPPALLMAVILAAFTIPTIYNDQIHKLLILLVIIPIIVMLGAHSESKNKSIEKVSDYLGWLSYPIYCIHFPIHSIYTALNNNHENGIIGLMICIGTTILLAHMLGKYYDEPLRKKLSIAFIK